MYIGVLCSCSKLIIVKVPVAFKIIFQQLWSSNLIVWVELCLEYVHVQIMVC